MIGATLARWSGWAPGLEDADAWRRWCEAPAELAVEGQPDGSFLPALLRRRCGPLARAMLATAFDCTDEAVRSGAATVFASRHGNINESIELLERVAAGQPLSPTRFSHTVHNAQAGLFSIAAGNREASSSIAAREATFGCGWLEALTLLEREPARPVLLVVADAPLDPDFAVQVDEPEAFYSLAFLLEAALDGGGIGLSHEARESDGDAVRPWPDACEFLRWWLGDHPELALDSGPGRWLFRRPS